MTGRRPSRRPARAPRLLAPFHAVGPGDLWSWVAVASDAGAAEAHRLARLDTDAGAAVMTCGRRAEVGELRRVVSETARRCAACEVVRGAAR